MSRTYHISEAMIKQFIPCGFVAHMWPSCSSTSSFNIACFMMIIKIEEEGEEMRGILLLDRAPETLGRCLSSDISTLDKP